MEGWARRNRWYLRKKAGQLLAERQYTGARKKKTLEGGRT